MIRFVITYTFLFGLFVSCKKETVQPDPIPGKVIIKKSPLTHSGYIETSLTINYETGNVMDTSLTSSIYLYDATITNPSQSVHLNSFLFDSYSTTYHLWLTSGEISTPFLSEYRSLKYSGVLPGTGNFTMKDNRPLGSFSNQNTVPLNFSKSNGYTCTLNNVANCDFIEARIGLNQTYRYFSIQSPTFKFFDSEILNSTLGSQTSLKITLIAEKDTVINNKKFFMRKNVTHNYILTFTN